MGGSESGDVEIRGLDKDRGYIMEKQGIADKDREQVAHEIKEVRRIGRGVWY